MWEPLFYNEKNTDTDQLRSMQCCVLCGAYIGDLPGYYYIEEDYCPNCRKANNEESWSQELKRLLEADNYDKNYIDDLLEQCENMEMVQY